MPIIKVKNFSRSKIVDDEVINEFQENKDMLNSKITCACGSIITSLNQTRHCKTIKHQDYLKSNDALPEEQIIEEEQEELNYQPDSPIEEPYIDYDYQSDDKFLEELNNENYKEEIKENKKQDIKPTDDYNSFFSIKTPKKQKPFKQIKSLYEDDDSIFHDIGTPLLGKNRREILSKITQYKNLFPKELIKFKVKKNATAIELQSYLEEMEAIVNCSSVENFLTDSILQCIKLVEGVSTYTNKYNIEGCADMLKSNPQFLSLTKMMYIKYRVFSEIPCEFQLLMVVATTAYICKSKNSKINEINSYLNQTINENSIN